jgi:hypothetical protein
MNNRQDILNELEAISPILCKLKENEKSLSVPENYFQELVDIVVFQANDESSILSSLKKEKVDVPANYFDAFGDSVLSVIKEEEESIALPKQQGKILSLFKRVAIAASIVGAVFMIKQIQQPAIVANDCTDGIACLTQDEIYNYMNANSHEFEVQDVQETVQPTIETTETKVDVANKDVEKYIENNQIILDADDASTDIF